MLGMMASLRANRMEAGYEELARSGDSLPFGFLVLLDSVSPFFHLCSFNLCDFSEDVVKVELVRQCRYKEKS